VLQDVEGKVAFVTGGASGIGLGMAMAFVGAGMKVAIADIRQDHLEEAMDQFSGVGEAANVLPIRLDVTDREAYAQAADDAVRAFGKVHVLCNNAGIGIGGSIKEVRYDDWDWGLGVLIGGVVNGVQTILPRILSHGEGGHILCTSSASAIVPINNTAIYTTGKAALLGLCEVLRGELAGDNVGVSAFCPGPVQTNIRESGRTRPERYKRDSGLAQREQTLQLRPNSPLWMTIEEVGQRVLAGIRRNDLYIFTHPEFKAGTAEKFETMMAAYPDEPINTERADAIRYLITNPIFARP
jgi:NADP-dependent 3-hydroxy acid dehydrogenase YdfG